MQKKALELVVVAVKGSNSAESSNRKLGTDEEVNLKSETVKVGEFSHKGLGTEDSTTTSTIESESNAAML